MSLRIPALLTAFFAVVSTIPAMAADSPLEGIPETAAVLVRLKSPDETVKKVADFAALINANYRKPITDASNGLGFVVNNPVRAGIDRKKDWWLIVFGKSGAAPVIAFAIPASDAEMMRKALGDDFKFASYENWVFYSKSEDALTEFEGRRSGKLKSASTAFDARSREVFDRSDLGAFVNVRQLRTVYRSELDMAKQQAHNFIEQMGKVLAQGPVQGFDPGSMVKMYGQIVDLAFQVADDATGISAGLVIGEKEIDVEGSLVVAAATLSDLFLARNTPAELKVVGRLPAEKPVYFGAAGDISGLINLGMSFASQMMKGNEQYQKALRDWSDSWRETKIGSICGTLSLGNPAQGVLDITTVLETNNPEKMRDMTLKITKEMGTLKTPQIKQTFNVTPHAEKVGSHEIDVWTAKQEFEPGGDPTGMGSTMLKTMYGPDGMVSRMTTFPGILAQSVGGGKEQMADLIQSLEGKETAGGRPAWAAARAKLPARANVIALVDVPKLATEVMRVLADLRLPGLPFDDGKIAELQKDLSASYIGMALRTEPHALVKNVVIPLEQAKGIAGLVEFIRTAREAK